MKARRHLPGRAGRNVIVRPTRKLALAMQGRLKDAKADAQGRLKLRAEMYAPILDLFKKSSRAPALNARAYRVEVSNRRKLELRRAASQMGGGMKFPSNIDPSMIPFAPVTLIRRTSDFMVLPVQKSLYGNGQFFANNDLSPGGMLSAFGVGGGTVVQQVGFTFTSEDVGPSEAAVTFNPRGSAVLDNPKGLSYVSCTAQLLVTETASSNLVAASDSLRYLNQVELNLGTDTFPTDGVLGLVVLFDRQAISYSVWLQLVFQFESSPNPPDWALSSVELIQHVEIQAIDVYLDT